MDDAIARINKLISVEKVDYKHCIDHVEHDQNIEGVKTVIRFHYVKFDGNGQPMLGALAETLYDYIIHYCIASRNRDDALTATQSARLTKEARKLFVHPEATEDDPDQTGEAGEMLLYFLIESILDAPQVVSKMELKTNKNKEINGSDGIHMKWCKADGVVDVYFGEAKIHQSLSGALGSAFKSISSFHDEGMYKHEFLMVTKHFKYADESIKKEVEKLIVRGEPGSEVRVNHACLIGYNWNEYKQLLEKGSEDIETEFRRILKNDAPRVVKLLNNRFNGFDKRHLNFDFFFMPFISVQEFRDAFNKALV
jgi:HamA